MSWEERIIQWLKITLGVLVSGTVIYYLWSISNALRGMTR